MSASSPVPADHPLMVAWEAYKATDDYANTKKWAGHDDQATDGSLWASFERGWLAAGGRRPFAPPAAGAPPALVALVAKLKADITSAEKWLNTLPGQRAGSAELRDLRETHRQLVRALGSPAPAPVAPPSNVACAGCGGRGVVGGYAPVEYAEGITGSEAVDVPCPDCQSPAPVAVAGGDVPEIRVGDVVIREVTDTARRIDGLGWAYLRDGAVWVGSGDASICRVERNGVVIWRRRQEGQ